MAEALALGLVGVVFVSITVGGGIAVANYLTRDW